MKERLPEPDPTAGAGRKPRIAVVFGGRSSEHAISCVTAGSVLRAIDRTKYDVIPIGITTDGQWVLESDDSERLAIEGNRLPQVDEKGGAVVLVGGQENREIVAYEPGEVPSTLGEVDVVFPLLHGPYGEDGTIQGMLEMAGVRYVGAGVFSSAAAMDKHYANLVLRASGLPVAPFAVLRPGEWARDHAVCRETVAALGYPVFVKPARGGSSIGISKVSDPSGLAKAIEEAERYDPKVVIEAAVDNAREIECGVLQGVNGGPPEASVLAEVRYGEDHDFYDFDAKYLPEEEVDMGLPADLPADVTREVQRLAIETFEAMSCEGLARIDFFVRDDGGILVNELNTMPGFTPHSMFPRMWAASGMPYPALVERLIRTAMHRTTGLR